ncbi:histidine phosphatase family protein [Klugiella xanthotipulae]|uniref:Putative phosphoglycerate mutase n=1 Tax=Klugiella xanthotipulae TaxID=244735 RepID=A0A543HXX7_9MICO|nr:histidine phosphatase family protein [Klugiella xanthotipulae]TQM63159.1 putative phosphoglycerate mutase [Klugiella xanthotipulae]
MTRTLYLVRHGEQVDAEHGIPDGTLSERGELQARAIAERFAGLTFDAAWHSPLKRAEETVRVMAQTLPLLDSQPSSLLLDCVPTGRVEGMPEVYAPFFGSYTADETEAGRAQMADATAEFLGGKIDTHELLVTHNFVIAWFVREAMDAPEWRWLGINQANCGLTIIQQRPGRPWTLLVHNDLSHLPVDLRTGLPESLPG